MKRIIGISILLNVFMVNSHAQSTLSIGYNRISEGTTSVYQLTTDGKISVWDFISTNSQDMIGLSSKGEIFFKSFKDSTIYYDDNIFSKVFQVKDSIYLFDWQLTGVTKSILGYNCQEATTHFRGRIYSAYFTTALPYADGPWKFGALPGLILEVQSTDAAFHYVATSIEKSDMPVKIPAVKHANYITWAAYCKKFITAFDNYIKQIQTTQENSVSGTVTIKVTMEEIIYPKIQTGNGHSF